MATAEVLTLTVVALLLVQVLADLEQAFPAVLDLQQAFGVEVVAVLTVVALAALEQVFPAVLDLQQAFLVVVEAVLTVVALTPLVQVALVLVHVLVLAAALAAAWGQP